MDAKQKRIATIKSLVSKWHIIRQKAVPLDHLLYAIAEDINGGIPNIPSDKIYECWMDAKGQSDFMPMDSSLNEAWKRLDKRIHSPNSTIEYKPKHQCRYCAVVSIRLGLTPPDATNEEKDMASDLITEDELYCVRASVSGNKVAFEHFNESPKSPYRGML